MRTGTIQIIKDVKNQSIFLQTTALRSSVEYNTIHKITFIYFLNFYIYLCLPIWVYIVTNSVNPILILF